MANEWKNEKIKKWKKRKLIDTQKNQREQINNFKKEDGNRKRRCNVIFKVENAHMKNINQVEEVSVKEKKKINKNGQLWNNKNEKIWWWKIN